MPRIPIDTDTGQQCGMPAHVGEPAACYGVMCQRRGDCVLYARLGATDGPVIGSCQAGEKWPLFVAKP